MQEATVQTDAEILSLLGAAPPASPQPQPKPAPKPAGIQKLSFGKLAPAKKEGARKTYPQFPDENGQAAVIADRIRDRSDQLDVLEGALTTDKADLRMMVRHFYFTHSHGKVEVPSSIAVAAPSGEVLVAFQNRYGLSDEGQLAATLGAERSAEFFRQGFDIKIKGDVLSTNLDGDQMQALLNDLEALFARYRVSNSLELKAGIKPVRDFHAARHLKLTLAENLALDLVCPIVVQIKTKGRE